MDVALAVSLERRVIIIPPRSRNLSHHRTLTRTTTLLANRLPGPVTSLRPRCRGGCVVTSTALWGGVPWLRRRVERGELIPFGLSTVSSVSEKTGSSGYQDDTSDEALLAGMALADDRACLVFVRRYQHRLFGLAIGIVGDARLAEEVTQEAFIRIYRHAEVFDARRASVSAWAFTITRNLAIDVLRVRRDIPTDPEDRVFLTLMSNERTPEDGVAADALGRVRVALADLPIDQRRAVLLAAMYGWSAAEIARAEAIPLGTAKGRIRLGMAKLRGALEIEAT